VNWEWLGQVRCLGTWAASLIKNRNMHQGDV
jgi:hypothetical protein